MKKMNFCKKNLFMFGLLSMILSGCIPSEVEWATSDNWVLQQLEITKENHGIVGLGGQEIFIGKVAKVDIAQDITELSMVYRIKDKNSFSRYNNSANVKGYLSIWTLSKKGASPREGDYFVVRVTRGPKSNQYFVNGYMQIPQGSKREYKSLGYLLGSDLATGDNWARESRDNGVECYFEYDAGRRPLYQKYQLQQANKPLRFNYEGGKMNAVGEIELKELYYYPPQKFYDLLEKCELSPIDAQGIYQRTIELFDDFSQLDLYLQDCEKKFNIIISTNE